MASRGVDAMTKRLPGVAGILAGVFLVVGTVPAVAVTPITGVGVDIVVVDEGDYKIVNGDRWVTLRDAVLAGIETTTDVRVSGEVTLTVGSSFPAVWYWWLVWGHPYPPGEPDIATVGSYLLENAGGAWQGHLHGRVLGDGLHVIDGVMRGTGNYAGLTYHYHLEMMAYEYWNVSGWISKG
jgi:hypothetical protein